MTQASDKPDAKADTATASTASTSAAPASEKNQSRTSKASSSGKGLVVLALLCGLGGLGAGVWSVMQIQAADQLSVKQQQQLSGVLANTQSVAKNEQQLRAQLEKMPSAAQLQQGRELLADVQAEQQLLAQRLETILGASRQDWRLAEAEHLLRMASLRLSALHDTNSAGFLLEAADHILMEQNDPAAFAAREQLARSITALRSGGSLDRTGLFVKLGALYQQANQLTHLAPSFTQDAQMPAAQSASHWERWWDSVSHYIRIDFNASEQVQPLLAGQSLTQVRLALGLALEQAQWAALNGAQAVYQQALQQALDILDAHFSIEDPNVKGLRTQISELSEQKVRQELPDLSTALTTLQAYINKRSAPQDDSTEESN